jgi:single-strand DNA-binding protein
MADNAVTIVGNLTREPELRFTNGGRAVASFGVACSRRYQVNGEWQEQTSFFNVVAWGQLGENAAQSLTKGSRIIVSGRLEQRQYEAKDGGGQRSIVEIVADELGPSLRWATAQIERTARTDAAGGGGGGNYPPSGGGGGGGGQPRSGGNSGGSTGAGNADSYGYGDEEPF